MNRTEHAIKSQTRVRGTAEQIQRVDVTTSISVRHRTITSQSSLQNVVTGQCTLLVFLLT